MDNKIDVMLEQLGSEIPKVNPYLSNKIYNTAKMSESKKTIPFFKKPFIIAFTSLIIFVVTIFGTISLNNTIVSKDNHSLNDSSIQGVTNESILGNINSYLPNLSPTTQNTVFIEHYYSIYTSNYDIMTIIINNKINYQKVYIKAYNLSISDIKVNNGEVQINEVTVDGELFFELSFDNSNTNIHYLDICFEKGLIENILSTQESLKLGFIMYIGQIDKNKGYGYDFQIKDVIDLREGSSL